MNSRKYEREQWRKMSVNNREKDEYDDRNNNFEFIDIFGVHPQISNFFCSLRSQKKSKISGRTWGF
ncbi:MAG: hypothetical protein RBQ94_06320 [Methanimicrococcus sp.]|nr:hypothetical protein [Methanimicrococcus sp.]